MTDLTPAAAWMDRLSDRIGAFVPGCARLPARHPVKVSLVMGALGLASGWMTMVVGFPIFFLTRHPARELMVFLIAGAVQAILVLVPWAMWLGVRWRWIVLLVLYGVLANWGCSILIDPYKGRATEFGLMLYGLLTGIYLSVAGSVLTRRFHLIWSIGTVFVSASALYFFVPILRNTHLDQYLPSLAFSVLIAAWFFSTIHMLPSLCLGYLLWDTTPRPKFEPGDAQ